MLRNLLPRLLLLHAAAIFVHQAASTDPPATSTVENSLQLFHVESRTSSITVNWTSNVTYNSYQVLALSLESGIVLIAQPTNATELTFTDLVLDTDYKVCVVANRSSTLDVTLVVTGKPDPTKVVYACLELSTIPVVRVDSVLVLLGVVAFVALSIVAAIFCWKCSRSEDAGGGDGGTEDGGENVDEMESADLVEFEQNRSQDLEAQPLLDADQSDQKKNQSPPETGFDSEPQPVDTSLQNNELPADGQADKPPLV